MMRKTDKVEEALLKIADELGRLTPQQVVEAATPDDHPLHDQFEWRDGVAAHQFRLDQARTLIRTVEVRIRIEKRIVRTVAYIRDPDSDPDQQGYVSVTKLRQNPDAARVAVVNEFVRAAAALRRARDLAVVLGTHGEEIDELLNRVTRLQDRIDDAAEAAPATA